MLLSEADGTDSGHLVFLPFWILQTMGNFCQCSMQFRHMSFSQIWWLIWLPMLLSNNATPFHGKLHGSGVTYIMLLLLGSNQFNLDRVKQCRIETNIESLTDQRRCMVFLRGYSFNSSRTDLRHLRSLLQGKKISCLTRQNLNCNLHPYLRNENETACILPLHLLRPTSGACALLGFCHGHVCAHQLLIGNWNRRASPASTTTNHHHHRPPPPLSTKYQPPPPPSTSKDHQTPPKRQRRRRRRRRRRSRSTKPANKGSNSSGRWRNTRDNDDRSQLWWAVGLLMT